MSWREIKAALFYLMDRSKWLEVSLRVDGELAEAVAEVLGRFTSGGVVIESTQIQADEEDEGQAVGDMKVYGYLPAGAELKSQCRKLEEALWHLSQIRALPSPQYRYIQETDWAEAWKEHFQPLRGGRDLLIVPAWWEGKADTRRTVVRIDPGMAFGTGTHPSTQLCLEAIEAILAGEKGVWDDARQSVSAMSVMPSMIDLGCGSGILAIAALKLGVRQALGVDIDPQAVQVARQNAAINGVLERLEVGVGSVGEVLGGAFSIRQAPLVVANILAPVLQRALAKGLGEIVSPGGVLILSGILEEQAEQVIAAAEARGLKPIERRSIQDWIALVFRKI